MMQNITTKYQRYEDYTMTVNEWHRLGQIDRGYWYGLIPSFCIPAPINWLDDLPGDWWFIPTADLDTWLLDAEENEQLAKALSWDYTTQLLMTLEDYFTGGNKLRHEGGNLVLIIEGQQRSGKSDLAKTVAKECQFIQYDTKGITSEIHVALTFTQFKKGIEKMNDNDIMIADEIDKWTGMASKNRLEGLLNMIQRIAMTGKSFIFVAPELRVKAIRDAGYLLLSTFGICYEYEMNRFFVKKKSRHSEKYQYLGLAAFQRNWWFGEFPEYLEQKRRSIRMTELRIGLETAWDMEEVIEQVEVIWDWTLNEHEIFEGDPEVFFAKTINVDQWRGFAGELRKWAKDQKDALGEKASEEQLQMLNGLIAVEIEALGTEYAKFVANQLSGRHKFAKFKHDLKKDRDKRAPAVGTTVGVRDRLELCQKDDKAKLPQFLMTFRLFARIPIDTEYIDLMASRHVVDEAISEEFGKKINDPKKLKMIQKLRAAAEAWKWYRILQSYAKAAKELKSQGIKISHQTVSNYESLIGEYIQGLMDELAFAKRYPVFQRLGGNIPGRRDFEHIEEEITVSKKCLNELTWQPSPDDLSRQERTDVFEGRCVFLVLTDLQHNFFRFFVAKKNPDVERENVEPTSEKLRELEEEANQLVEEINRLHEETLTSWVESGIELFNLRDKAVSKQDIKVLA